MNKTSIYSKTRIALHNWQQQIRANILLADDDLNHSFQFYFPDQSTIISSLNQFASEITTKLESLVIENNLDKNLPVLQPYDAIGNPQNKIQHHPSYVAAGDIIYGSRLTEKLATIGNLTEGLAFLLLSSHAGEAGHNCPIACSAGVMRILNKTADFPDKPYYLQKLTAPSFANNFTGAQFLTEVQGGSDVGANACVAQQNEFGTWVIKGEKWFCSNANADLILMTARFDEKTPGTKGLGLFLVPAKLSATESNHYVIRQLKQKIGTRSMATAEIDFNNAVAIPIGEVTDGIHLVLENVLHLSRIFNAFSVLGMSRRAFQIAFFYAKNRTAFGSEIINYPLVKEQLAKIKAIYTAQLAASFAIAKLQDEFDLAKNPAKETKLLLRLLTNLNKYFTAKFAVENIRHCIDILAGNGTIQTFSTLPRLLCDAIVCENWEGTHFTLWMQILRDIEKFRVDELFIDYVKMQLSKIDQQNESCLKLHSSLLLLLDSLTELKLLSVELKTLKIQDVVLQMSVIYSSVMLLKEAEHQQVNDSNTSKFYCLQLFMQLFLDQRNKPYDLQYLNLLKKVLGE